VEAAERPGEGLELTWALSPAWQAAVPHGGSVFGIRNLVRWVAGRYGITQDWLFAQHVPSLLSDADQVRLAKRMDPAG
ncbi:hypothetical protein LNK15_15535, partial [Jeotgalicoccus huakuii]|nr:hypothetical protein [Jeotgalicoccus huakuii]